MTSSRHWGAGRAGRLRAAFTSLSFLLLAVAGGCGPAARGEETGVSKVLDRFERSWDGEAWGPAKDRGQAYMRPVNDDGWKRRMEALQQLVRIGSRDAGGLVEALRSDSAPVRALAAQALGYCGQGHARPALAEAVERDADAMVRLYAADSLGMLGGGDFEELLRRAARTEKNRDAKRHIGYALDREGEPIRAEVAEHLRQWNREKMGTAILNRAAPDFELVSLDGHKVRLSDFRGKKSVVLIFVYGDT